MGRTRRSILWLLLLVVVGLLALVRFTLGGGERLDDRTTNPLLRWPDGFSFGPDGWLYVSCSALHQVILRSSGAIRAGAPYQIFRFKPWPAGVPGR